VQDRSANVLRKVLRVIMVIWAVLPVVFVAGGILFGVSIGTSSSSMVQLLIGVLAFIHHLLYWALIPFGTLVILWAAHTLKAPSRIVVLCAGAVMVFAALWYIHMNSMLLHAMFATDHNPPFFGLPPLAVFLYVVLVALGSFLFAGGVLLQKERRGVWTWTASTVAFFTCMIVIVLCVFNKFLSYYQVYEISVFVLVAVSTLCLAIGLKRPRSAVGSACTERTVSEDNVKT